MIQVTHDDDGTLMVSIPAGEHALRERVLMLALQEMARPTSVKELVKDAAEEVVDAGWAVLENEEEEEVTLEENGECAYRLDDE